jgi:DNA-binding GntR family transcriptional regulator
MVIASKLPLSEKAYLRIRESIITMELAPGSQVDEHYLMRKLSIGRTPIREALFRLLAEELLENLPNRGFFVRPITLEDTRFLFEAMLISIKAHLPLSAKRAQKKDIDYLHKVHEAYQTAIQKRDFLEMTTLNNRFHSTICEASKNRYLVYSAKHIQNQSQRLSYLSYTKEIPPYDLEGNLNKVIESHERIISLIEKKDASGLLNKMVEHTEAFYYRVFYYLSPSIDLREEHLAQTSRKELAS